MTAPAKLALRGAVVPLHKNNPRRVLDGGTLYVDDGVVVAVKAQGAAAPAGFDGSDVVTIDCGSSWVLPGLIDLHSHIGYNALPLWTDPDQTEPYLHHDRWPDEPSYRPMVGWPAWTLAKAAPESLMTYVQVRALAGGTTTIQGWPTTNRRPANQLVRNADDQAFPDVRDPIVTSALTLDDADLQLKAQRLAQGKGFIYHCAEGQDGSLVTREFDELTDAGCLRAGLIAIHLTAVRAAGFERWSDLARLEGDAGPGTLVWSPFSNLWLYGETTRVPDAMASGVNVCLGTDWGPSGTKNLLGELKVARMVADSEGWDLDDLDLVEMVTVNPGDALSRFWKRPVGRFVAGSLADVTVITRRDADPFTSLVEAYEEDVQLVLVDGVAQYGTADLMAAAGRGSNTSVRVGSARRRVVLTEPADKHLPVQERRKWFYARALRRLEEVRADPDAAVAAPEAFAGASARGEPVIDAFVVTLDMPGGFGLTAGPPPAGVTVDFSDLPIPSLRHDGTWMRRVKRGGFHGGLLDGLDTYYG
jgi:cytosine/adenosine deaminase-related metal-dependent hydrolase